MRSKCPQCAKCLPRAVAFLVLHAYQVSVNQTLGNDLNLETKLVFLRENHRRGYLLCFFYYSAPFVQLESCVYGLQLFVREETPARAGKKSKGGGCQLSQTNPAPAPWVTGVLANTASCPGSFSQWERRVSLAGRSLRGQLGPARRSSEPPRKGEKLY